MILYTAEILPVLKVWLQPVLLICSFETLQSFCGDDIGIFTLLESPLYLTHIIKK